MRDRKVRRSDSIEDKLMCVTTRLVVVLASKADDSLGEGPSQQRFEVCSFSGHDSDSFVRAREIWQPD